MIRPISLSSLAYFMLSQRLPNALKPQLKGGDALITGISTDTRTLAAGELCIALRGDNFDAHDFLEQAVAKHPCGFLVERYNPRIHLPQLVVADTTLALGQLAALNRSLFNGPLVAITGSSGKTTVKTLVAAILSEAGETLATRGNLNNHIGVPLTLLELEARHQLAVIEMGASGPGEIAYACSLAKPQVAMVNNVMPAHIEGFGSIAGVASAKGEIYDGLVAGGIAVVNLDDAFAPQWLAQLAGKKVLRVALSNNPASAHANCYARNIEYGPEHLAFDLHIHRQHARIILNAQGEHSVRNALMASACAYALGISLDHIQRGLARFTPVNGRMNRLRGIANALIIDDSYNANPGSVRAAIDVLALADDALLILGDMAELGEAAAQQHAALGAYAKQKNIKRLFTLGQLSAHASEQFGADAQHFTERDQLVAAVTPLLNAHITVLVKGSRSARMERVVQALCATCGENI